MAVFEIHPDFFARAIESGGLKPVTLQQIPPARFVTSRGNSRKTIKAGCLSIASVKARRLPCLASLRKIVVALSHEPKA
ncbi:MAG: hypothetical protein C5B58_06280 [Acidobacteria bacterium]|nr:MAG: hypothetical protein C5B58_06280 [Acidobacteriota bacterium]